MSTANPTARTRLASPGWTLDITGNFKLDLSWDDDSHRWLEVVPDPHPHHLHRWLLVLHEASDDSSEAVHEVIGDDVDDPAVVMVSVEADPFRYDREPIPKGSSDARS